MPFDQEPRRPWGGFQLLILIGIGGAVAWYLFHPAGLFISDTFQRIIDAFKHHR